MSSFLRWAFELGGSYNSLYGPIHFSLNKILGLQKSCKEFEEIPCLLFTLLPLVVILHITTCIWQNKEINIGKLVLTVDST